MVIMGETMQADEGLASGVGHQVVMECLKQRIAIKTCSLLALHIAIAHYGN